MTRTRRVKSVKAELIKKSREAMLSAVQIYNNPQVTFKAETFITLAIISWTYLLHAYFRSKGIDYRYFKQGGKKKVFDKTKHGAYRHWDLEHCLNHKENPLDSETTTNLRFLIGIRHEIEHQMTDKIDEDISAKLQACAINFDYHIGKLFDEHYCLNRELALTIQFSPLSPQQYDTLRDTSRVKSSVRNFVVDFESSLTEEELKSSRYAYRVLFMPINVNRVGQADRVIEFVKSDSPLAENIKKEYAMIKETEKQKYLPKEIVSRMKKQGFRKFNIYKHTQLWQSMDAKNPNKRYGVMVSEQWYWYETWLLEVEKYCREHSNELKGNRK